MVVHVDIFRKQGCRFQYADPNNRWLLSQSTEKIAKKKWKSVLFSEKKPIGSRNIRMMMMMMIIIIIIIINKYARSATLGKWNIFLDVIVRLSWLE
jgi:hypothetical protein